MKKFFYPILLLIPSIHCKSQSACLPASEYIIEQYKSHNIIAIDEGPHGTIENHKFLRDLLQNEKISKTVQYIILEFVNIQHQDILDDYINGKPVPLIELQKVWRATTQAHNTLFENPEYLLLLKTVKEINLKLAPGKKIRVLAGDPPIDWSKIKTLKDFFSNLSQRDVLPSQLAIQYGIDSLKKVLLIYGGEHLKKTSDEKKDSTFWTIPYFINKKFPNSVITIGNFISEDHASGAKDPGIPLNSICDLNKSSLGGLSINNDTGSSSLQMKNIFDAVYYIGQSKNWETGQPSPIDPLYWEELNRRSKIVWQQEIDEKLKRKN